MEDNFWNIYSCMIIILQKTLKVVSHKCYSSSILEYIVLFIYIAIFFINLDLEHKDFKKEFLLYLFVLE